MRWWGLVLFALGLSVAFSSSPRAESPWYLSVSAGAYLRQNQAGATTFRRGDVTGPGTQAESFDAGPTGDLAVGYRLLPHVRVEAEFGYASYRPSKVNPLSATFPALNGSDFNLESGGGRNRYTSTANVFYDLPLEGRFVPYVGGGVGFMHAEGSPAQFVNAGGVRFNQTEASGNHGVALLEGGLTIAIDHSWSIVPAYRYVRAFGNANTFGDEEAHIFKVGVRYSF